MKRIIVVSFLVAVLGLLAGVSIIAEAGEWGSSGGGEFMRDLSNPWFVKGISQVKYCLEVDSEGISARPEKIKSLVQEALEYWRGEFKGRGELLGIGIQEFQLSNNFPMEKCSGAEDLRIQLGYQTLSAAQLAEFTVHGEDPLDYVGIAVRESYDKVALRGKGFVFVGSDRGTHQYNHGVGVESNLWNHDGLLFRILQHELGHMFGVAHTETGFMAADFPEYMVRNYLPYRTIQKIPFFMPQNSFIFCDSQKVVAGKTVKCVGIRTQDKWRSYEVFGIDADNQELSLGNSIKVMRTSTRQQFPIKIFLPKEQQVYTNTTSGTVFKGPARTQFNLLSEVKWIDGQKQSLLVELGQDGAEVYRVKEDGSIERWL